MVCGGIQKSVFLTRDPGYYYKVLKTPVWVGFVEKLFIKEGPLIIGFEVGVRDMKKNEGERGDHSNRRENHTQ